ncbi:sugar ABC transporter ATP-binding protein [Rhizobium sp. 18055]|uniref:sugar ABC transporter ATP-binding protein n=1 Tax=Rhizobium sp. 18055 TaxID=2681403 RepID=UPI0013587EED|nr:sugar ABC transporter ATP-binding protein [Rhizobium sp. 18055]
MDNTSAVGLSVPLIHAEGVTKSYGGVRALLDGRLTLRRGEVHALLGGNGAGKSTFLSILTGIVRADGGQVNIKGRPVRYMRPSDALADGIAIITQELSAQPEMTVAQNLFLGIENNAAGFLNDRAMIADAKKLLDTLGFDLDPNAKMKRLSVAQQQIVEIAKAINRRSDILIMDEPTSALGDRETEILFEAIRRLRSNGIGIIYVSHRLTDIFQIADRYTIFGDGRFVETGNIADIDRAGLIRLIVGRTLPDQVREQKLAVTEPLLEVRDFSAATLFTDINLTVCKGEVLGIFGLMGAGRSEFAEALFGNARKDRGEVKLNGQPIDIKSPTDALSAGIAMVTEDRASTGLILLSSIRDNISLPALRQFSRGGIIKGKAEAASVRALMEKLRVKAASSATRVRNLSGGNQQKVVLAKCLNTSPKFLICDEPTRGVDEGAKREIYAFLADFASRGNGALFISSEVPELIANTDRIIVFKRGSIVAEVKSAETSQEQLLHLAS